MLFLIGLEEGAKGGGGGGMDPTEKYEDFIKY